jgi:phage portal protein BeeE
VFRTAPDGTRTPARDHPLYGLLHDSPNADQTALRFLGFRQFVDRAQSGNAFAAKEQSARSDGSARLTLINPDAMTVRRASSGADL